MSSDKQDENAQASELDSGQLDEVVGGRKALQTALRPKKGGAGIAEDPCAGGE